MEQEKEIKNSKIEFLYEMAPRFFGALIYLFSFIIPLIGIIFGIPSIAFCMKNKRDNRTKGYYDIIFVVAGIALCFIIWTCNLIIVNNKSQDSSSLLALFIPLLNII